MLNGGEYLVLQELNKHRTTNTDALNTKDWAARYGKQHFIDSLVEYGYIEATNESYRMTKNGTHELKRAKKYMRG